MKLNKRGDAKFIYLIIILVLIGILIINFGPNITSTEEDQKNTWEKINKETTKFDNLPEGYDPRHPSETSSSGEYSSESNSEGEEKETCTTRLLRYSIITTKQTETCNEYDGEYCINKTAHCSAIIKNDDLNYGEYQIELIFVPEKTSKETDGFNRQTANYLLAPKEQIIMSGTAQINSIGEEGLANKKINCFFNTINDMIQKVCI